MEDPFWTLDTSLFEGQFHYYRDKKQPVRGKIHISEEEYDFYGFGHSLERSYLKQAKGKRTYLFMRPYIARPKLVMSFTLQPKHYHDAGAILGKTTGTHVAGVRHDEIGNAQAWYYPEERVLVLWECFLDEFVRDAPLREDANMDRLWENFEHWLLARYPETERIITPDADPMWDMTEYQAFLRKRGYTKGRPGTFTKLLR